jgi:hypothetical protein
MSARTYRNWWKQNSWWISLTRLLTSANRTWDCTWYICKGCQRGFREWTSRKHQEYLHSLCGQRQWRVLFKLSFPKKTGELFILSWKQITILTTLPTGRFHLQECLFKLWLMNGPKYDRYKQASETASHILCDCAALATLRFGHLGCHFLEQVTLKTSLPAVQGVGPPTEWAKGLHERSITVEVHGSLGSHSSVLCSILFCSVFNLNLTLN